MRVRPRSAMARSLTSKLVMFRVTPVSIAKRSAPDRLAERFGLVRPFPGEPGIAPPEMPKGGGPPVNGPAQIQRLDDFPRLQAEVLANRSEEHTSELQSRPHLVCRLLLEKKKNNQHLH